jgi:hypothetical protein
VNPYYSVDKDDGLFWLMWILMEMMVISDIRMVFVIIDVNYIKNGIMFVNLMLRLIVFYYFIFNCQYTLLINKQFLIQ